MFHLNKVFLSLSIVILTLPPIAYAESNNQTQTGSQLQTQVELLQIQIQQLQTQLTDANSRIANLEAAKNTANQDIKALQTKEALMHSSDVAKNDIRRMANGHGR